MTTKEVTLAARGDTLQAYYAVPEADAPLTGVVVIHEIFGLNDNIRDIAERFADEGYAALAVDLFSGRNRAVCMAQFMAGMLTNSLHHGGIQDVKAALDYLVTRPEVDEKRVGAIGFCMGGGFAVAWACTDDRLKAIAPFYGMNPRPLEAVRRACPVVGSYPEKDFTAGAGAKLDEVLDSAAIPHDIKIYPGAKHSFMNDRGGSYDAAVAADAWNRTLLFFGEQLG
ncbi:dienelactone hydrolase family protein [soil metagenome]